MVFFGGGGVAMKERLGDSTFRNFLLEIISQISQPFSSIFL
jgi:hypothetical protein